VARLRADRGRRVLRPARLDPRRTCSSSDPRREPTHLGHAGLAIWTIVCFLIALWVLKRYAFGPIQRLIDTRQRAIEDSIETAEKARDEAQELLEQNRKLIGEARGQSEAILAEARKTRESMEQRMREETEAERQRRLEETRKEIAVETARASNRSVPRSPTSR
jgi:ATP synthase F0 subunit b